MANEETVNEYLHISALQRWQLESVLHDVAENKDKPLKPYRPPNLAAVIQQARSEAVPVIGWDGELIAPENIKCMQ